jgi:HEPN domain-containing protein
VTNVSLADSYLRKARARLKILPVLAAERAWSDVVRESQEIVELALKGMLRHAGIEPPKWHDVGSLLQEYQQRFAILSKDTIAELAAVSARLRKEREFAFYGDIDFIPTEQYTEADSTRAIADARNAVTAAAAVIEPATGENK